MYNQYIDISGGLSPGKIKKKGERIMFCPKCGAQNADGSRFCGKCGEPMNSGNSGSNLPAVTRSAGKSASSVVTDVMAFLKANVKLVGIVAGALAAILLFSLLFGGRGYKKTVNKFMDSLLDMDAKGMVAMLPDEVMEAALAEEGYTKKDKKILIAQLQEELDYGMSYMSMMGDLKMKYKIVVAENVSGEDLAYQKQNYAEIGAKVSAAKEVEVELSVKVLGMTETETVELVVVKFGRSWYIDIESMGDLL